MYAVHSINYHKNTDPGEIVEQVLRTGSLLPLVDRLPVEETGMQPVDLFAGDHYLVFLRARTSWPNQSTAFVFDVEDLIARGAGFRKNDLLMSYWGEARLVAADLRADYGLNYSESTILMYLAAQVIDQFPAMLNSYLGAIADDFQAIDMPKLTRSLEARLSKIAEEGTYYGEEALALLEDPNSKAGYSEIVWRGPLSLSLADPESPAF